MRAMERERRLREGEDTSGWEIGGFEKHTKVCVGYATYEPRPWYGYNMLSNIMLSSQFFSNILPVRLHFKYTWWFVLQATVH